MITPSDYSCLSQEAPTVLPSAEIAPAAACPPPDNGSEPPPCTASRSPSSIVSPPSLFLPGAAQTASVVVGVGWLELVLRKAGQPRNTVVGL
eukprot:CAMPEP_0185763530 /NCGR_PEP_ID=MMETSP1174-20130828/22464_1 /TAXON_ID=35687 /ORGANISM="Dictyocha speculum, Strain CCMP1381" /LENGTH=91 /DNA_ID=CAMNT_0028445685 /DNA_START=297 /DNA_END=572 /DNA_ORIENTATION=-